MPTLLDIRAALPGLAQGALIAAAALLALWLAIAWYEARHVRIERHTVHDARIPVSLDGATLLFAADIHAGPIFGSTRVEHLVETINAEEPDIIVLGGDYVGGHANGATVFYPAIGTLRATHGVFAVLGNHDVWEGVGHAREGMRDAGIELLENDVARIEADGGSIAIAGLEDEWTGMPNATAVSRSIGPDEFAVLAAHNPDSFVSEFDSAGTVDWGLALAGHTHGGQLHGVYWLMPHKPTAFGSRFLGGWSMEGETPLLVSNGVGAVTLPLRFLAPPQIHVITLRRSRS